jgi:D-psicose/D-tagatose/L-ribulose 3-epimerase
VRRAGGHVVEFHACSSDRGTPGEGHLPWPQIVGALRDVDYHGPVVIEAFTPKIKEIARAVSIWRRWRRARNALASNGLRHLKAAFAKGG